MNLSDNQIQILQTIKSKLKHGDQKEIAQKSGVSESFVARVLNPDNDAYNEEVIHEAVSIIEEREKKEKELLEKLQDTDPDRS